MSAATGQLKQAIIRVGEGRGFVVERKSGRCVITAAHCLPWLPPCCACSHLEERTYHRLLGLLGDHLMFAAECIFADPVSDIAVLANPDSQAFAEDAEAYEALMENTGSLRIDDMPDEAEAHLLSLDGQWISACASKRGGGIWLSNIRGGSIEGGMSGSPIVIGDAAVGVVCVGGGATGEPQTEGGPQPRLYSHLSFGLLAELRGQEK